MTEKNIKQILASMQDFLTPTQLHKLENVLFIQLHESSKNDIDLNELSISDDGWYKPMRLYIASKKLENCSNGTLKNYERCLRMLFSSLNKRLRNITTNDLRYYLAVYHEQRKISLSYMETLRHYISSFFSWACDEGYIESNPARRLKKIKVPSKIRKPLTSEEREILKCSAKTQRDLAIMEILYSTAARIGEIVSLNRQDIDFNNKEVIISGQKGKRERKVYLTGECLYHLQKYLESRKDNNAALFVSTKSPHTRLGKEGIEAMLAKLGAQVGIHVHPHKFRRTFLTDAGARGWPLQEIQNYAGHVKTDTTMLYVNVKEENIKSSFQKLIA